MVRGYVLGKAVQRGHGSVLWVVAGTAAAAALFVVGSVLFGWLTVRLVPKS